MLIFLWFVGHETGSFRDIADRFNITINSLHRIIQKVSVFLNNLSPQIIVWPDENEKREIEEHFRENGLPGAIGSIDGTHVKIDRPRNVPDFYINRKGCYSVQVSMYENYRFVYLIRSIFL